MKNYYLKAWVLVICMLPLAGWAQDAGARGEVNPGTRVTAQLRGVASPATVQEDWGTYFKTVKKVHKPQHPNVEEFRRLKAEANRQHAMNKQAGANQLNEAPASQLRVTGNPPTQGINYFGNPYGGGDPADNAMAVNNAGEVLSSVNSNVYTYDASGNQTSGATFSGFVAQAGISGFMFDPKVIYDQDNDRFVIIWLKGASPNSSEIVICFSQTSDPAGNYNIYTVSGNVNNNNFWTDFVQMGQSIDEIFITGNLVGPQSIDGAAIWQINKAEGYAGNPLSVQVYETGFFSLHPVEGGITNYGPHFYLIDVDFGSSADVRLHRISNTIANNGVLESPLTFSMNIPYTAPPDADQRGTATQLQTNDTRVQTSYFENNRIEFALNTGFGGEPAIFHGTGEISPFLLSFSSFSAEVVQAPGWDIAYPSLAYAGTQAADGTNHSFLGFLYASNNDYPGNGAVYIDENGISPPLSCRAGVNRIVSADNRWGDYADMQSRSNNPGEVWVSGTFGNSSLRQRTYISQLFPPQPVANEEPIVVPAEMEIYPNPTTERVTFDFPVEADGEYRLIVRDAQGRTVKVLVEDRLVAGEARIGFNTSHLAAGTYLVSVENDQQVLFNDKFVVKH